MTAALVFVGISALLIGGAIWRAQRAGWFDRSPYLESEDDSFLYDHAESRGE